MAKFKSEKNYTYISDYCTYFGLKLTLFLINYLAIKAIWVMELTNLRITDLSARRG